MNYRAFPAIALALAAGSAEVTAQPTTPPPPPTAGAVRPPGSVGEVPPGGQWVWQQSVYGGGSGYWAFIKPQDPSNFRHVGTATQ